MGRQHWWRRWLGTEKTTAIRRPSRNRPRLQVEALEDRTAPAVFNPLASAGDGGPGSLRDAILQANSNADASNTINLDAGTYVLTETTAGNLLIANSAGLANKTLTIAGVGQNSTTVAGTQGWSDRIFHIVGTSAAPVTVTFQDFAIEGGRVHSVGADGASGGGMLIQGNFTLIFVALNRVTVRNNMALGAPGNDGVDPGQAGGDGDDAAGGGIYVTGALLALNDCTVTDNHAAGGDGGDGNNGPAGVSTLQPGGAGGSGGDAAGGGIYALAADLRITNSQIADNMATGGWGGRGGNGNLYLGVGWGQAGGAGGSGGDVQGGGLVLRNSGVRLINSTVRDNVALGGDGGMGGRGRDGFYQEVGGAGGSGGDGGFASGGGVFSASSNLSYIESVLENNGARGGVGGEGHRGGDGWSPRLDGVGGGEGGAGGDGGYATGGGHHSEGSIVTVINIAVRGTNYVVGAPGGRAGEGGDGGIVGAKGGSGGNGGQGLGASILLLAPSPQGFFYGGSVTGGAATGGLGGFGGNGGDAEFLGGVGGAGGNGGSAVGAALYVDSLLPFRINGTTFTSGQLVAGANGSGASGGISTRGNGFAERGLPGNLGDTAGNPIYGNTVEDPVVPAVNQAPVLTPIGNRTISAGGQLTFPVVATDADRPAQRLTYFLAPGAPAQANINVFTGVFSWATSDSQEPGDYSVTVEVWDGGYPSLSASQTFTISVLPVLNYTPVLTPIASRTVRPGELLTIEAVATDADLPAQGLTYSLDPGAPAQASINPTTGAFSWIPSDSQGPGVYTVTIRVTDDGTPSLSASRTFTITVFSASNHAPVLNSIGNRTIHPGELLTFTAVATDNDLPAQSLTYSLDLGAPAQASINPTTGVFAWTPSDSQEPGDYSVTVEVWDDGYPSLSDAQTFTITITQPNRPPADVQLDVQASSIQVGDAVTLTGTFTDPDAGDTHLVMIDWGDSSAPTRLELMPGETFFSAEHTYLDYPSAGRDSFLINVTVSDGFLSRTTYHFDDSLVGTQGAPSLTALGSGQFMTDSVFGSNQRVYAFDAGSGLTLDTSGLIPHDNYSIELVLRLDDVVGYQKIADFENRTTDPGWYVSSGKLEFFPGPRGGSVAAGRYYHLVLTRSLSDGVVIGYVDGAEALRFTDTSRLADIDNPGNLLNFFVDDRAGQEVSSGRIALLRMYDRALTADEVLVARAALDGAAAASLEVQVVAPAANGPPTDIDLSATDIAENSGAGAVVGSFSTTDPDTGDTFSYSLVTGNGSTDNSAFTIVGQALHAIASLDFESKNNYSVRVRSTDSGGLYVEEPFTITVLDVNEAPVSAAESFDYPDGIQSLEALVGGFGFNTAWFENNLKSVFGGEVPIADGSLNFPGLATAGNRLSLPVAGFLERGLTSSPGIAGTTAYFSFLLRPEEPIEPDAFLGLSLLGDAMVFIGKSGAGDQTHYVLELDESQSASSAVAVPGETVLLVVRADFTAGIDTLRLYVNPAPGGTEPDVADATLTAFDLGLVTGLGVSGVASFDEIHVGDTFADVVAPNTPPSNVQLDPPSAPLNEGDTFNLTGSFSDPDNGQTHTLFIDWGDGSDPDGDGAPGEFLYPEAGLRSFEVPHIYRDNPDEGTDYTITMTVLDQDSASSPPATTTITVLNVAPDELHLNVQRSSITEGQLAQISGLSFTDPGMADGHGVTINWGDGSAETTLTMKPGMTSLTGQGIFHRYRNNPPGDPESSYQITLTIIDGDDSASIEVSIRVNNAAPLLTVRPDLAEPILIGPNLLANPGFEAGDFTGWTVTGPAPTGVATDGTPIADVTPADTVVNVRTGNHAAFAKLSAKNVLVNAILSQTVAVTGGVTYDVGFWASLGTLTGNANRQTGVSINGQAVLVTTIARANGTTPADFARAHAYWTAGPDVASATVEFNLIGGGPYPAFDPSPAVPTGLSFDDFHFIAQAIGVGDTFTGAGNFIDPGQDTWTLTVDYGDNSPVQPVPVGKSFIFSHEYTQAGIFPVLVTVTDADGDSDTATFGVQVMGPPPNNAPVADPLEVTTDEDTDALIVPAGADADGDSLTFEIVTSPAFGTLTDNGDGTFTYAPDPDYYGPDSFEYRAFDGLDFSEQAVVSITVNPVNDAPVAYEDDPAYTEEDAPGNIDVAANDFDLDGDPLTIVITNSVGGAATVDADGTVLFTPEPDFNGEGSFTYLVSDGQADSNEVTVAITVDPVNDDPVAVDDEYSANEDTDLVIDVGGVLDNDSDVDGDPLEAYVQTGPAHGTLTLNPDGTFTYTPDPEFNGTDSFTYFAEDGQDGSALGTVTITVSAINDAPVADDLAVLLFENDSTISLTGSDVETPAKELVFTIASLPTQGKLMIGTTAVKVGDTFTGGPAGMIFQLPFALGNFVDTFTYYVTDTGDPKDTPANALASAPAVVTIQTGPNSDGIAWVGGTAGDDAILVGRTGNGANLHVTVNGTVVSNTTPMTALQEVRVFGLAGADGLRVNGTNSADTFGLGAAAILYNVTPVAYDSVETRAVNGGGGQDTLAGPDAVNTWTIDHPTLPVNAGNLNGETGFESMESLLGGELADTFVFGAGKRVTGRVNGGSGLDTLDYRAYLSAVSVNLQSGAATGTGSFVGIEAMIGSEDAAALTTLIGANRTNTWVISGIGKGTVNDTIGDFSFELTDNLTGGTAADTLLLGPGGAVPGTIDGRGNTDTLNYGAYAAAVTVNLQTGTATGVGSLLRVEILVGSPLSDTLIAADKVTATTWNVTGTNAGNIGGGPSFSSFENLIGGAGPDKFKFTPETGILSGVAQGGGGVNALDYTLFAGSVVVDLQAGNATATGGVEDIRDVTAGPGDDSLTGDGSDNVLDGKGGNDTVFGGAGNDTLLGGIGNDLLLGQEGDDTLNGGGDRDILIGGPGADTLDGGAADDILIGGTTNYDADRAALDFVMAEWSKTLSGSALAQYNARVNTIKTTPAPGQTAPLTASDDGVKDTMTGANGNDWFFYRPGAPADPLADDLINPLAAEVKTAV